MQKKQSKMTRKVSFDVFFALLRAGLWEKDVRLSQFNNIELSEISRLAEEQSVVGLVAAGLVHVVDVKLPKEDVLQFVGQAFLLEQQNQMMNTFIGNLIKKMCAAGIYTLLVKGQGLAQCYEKPLWRSCGDVDFLLSDNNYTKAKAFLIPLSSSHEKESVYGKHLGMTIDPWVVELHGSLRCGLSKRMDKVIDEVQNNVFCTGNVRSWENGGTQVFLPLPDNDVIFIFTHFLKHYYKGGLGLRQICDWCRLLWTYRDTLNHELLESRIRKMGLMTEWKAFAAFAVNYLGMPVDAMPLFNGNDNQNQNLHRKAELIKDYVLEVGNFGHNRDMSYYNSKPYLVRKSISLGRRCGDLFRHAQIFPLDSMRFMPSIIFNGLRSAAKGE